MASDPRSSDSLRRITDQLDAASRRLHALVDRLSEERWALRSDPDRWSVAECVEHLNLTGRAYVPLIESGLQEARRLGGDARSRYRRDLVGWFFSIAAGPLPRIGGIRLGRMPTIPDFEPKGHIPKAETVAEFDRLQERQVELVGASVGLPIDRVSLTSPFDGRVRYSLYSALRILPRHQERHILQAEEVVRVS